jgi:hypothetical protein
MNAINQYSREAIMPRARTLKYEFFRNEALGYMPPHARLLFAGLWCLADKEGRLEDRPGLIKGYLFGYEVSVTPEVVDDLLALLDDADLIRRYHVDGGRYISIVKWSIHQHPHPREIASVIPAPPKARPRHGQGHAKATPEHDQGDVEAMNGHDQGNAKDMLSPSLSSLSSFPSMPSMPSGLTPLRSTLSPEQSSLPRTEKPARGERLAPDWRLPLAWGEWAMRECGFMREQVQDIALRFADYWHAKAGRTAYKLDWLATWRNWCRKARDDGDIRAAAAGARVREERHRIAVGLTGYDSTKAHDVFDLPPEDCHVVVPKH